MMGRRSQDTLCFLCDYGLIILGLFLVLVVFFQTQISSSTLLPLEPTRVFKTATLPISTQIDSTIESTTTPPQVFTQVVPTSKPETSPPLIPTLNDVPPIIPESATPTTSVISTPTDMPEFIIVFIPLRWAGSADSFSVSANEQVDIFIKASNIDQYFRVKIKILDQGLGQVSLSDDTLVDKVIEFGLKTYPADRYVGLTDGDLVLENSSWVAGWTYGPETLGVVAESGGKEISAHELGHTFGLCDEYNYSYWKAQNETFPDGCPNPYPNSCTKDDTLGGITCDGNPTTTGRNSIMGPAGMNGKYGFNSSSLEYLHKKFQSLSDG